MVVVIVTRIRPGLARPLCLPPHARPDAEATPEPAQLTLLANLAVPVGPDLSRDGVSHRSLIPSWHACKRLNKKTYRIGPCAPPREKGRQESHATTAK